MNLLWLMTVIALLAVNVIAQDVSDDHFMDLVRRKAQTETDLSEEEDGKMFDSSHEVGDDNLEEQDPRKRTSNRPEYSNKHPVLNQPMQASLLELRQSRREEGMKKDLFPRRCKTLRCRLRYVFESGKDGNQELSADMDDRGADEPKKRCMAWQCKRHLLKTREKVLSKKSQNTENKRCLAWGCKRRSLEVFKRDGATTQDGDKLKEGNLGIQERSGVKRNKQSKRCMTRECKKEEELQNTDLKKRALRKCLAWTCKEGKRTAAMKQSREIDTSKRIVSRKPDNALGLFGSSRDGKCRGLECLTKRTRLYKNADAASLSKKDEMQSHAKKEPEEIDTSKRIVSRKPDDVLGLFGSSRDGKCRGLECLTKRMRENRNADAASLSRKNEMPSGCMTWECYGNGKRTAAKKEPGEIDSFKRIISRKNDKDLLGPSNEKCRGWECLKKRVVHGAQNDIPTKCLSWDCDKRRADTGESTKTQEDVNEQFQEKDASQYGIPEEYKDMIQRPIRRDAWGRISAYLTDRGSRRTIQKEDIQEK